MKLNYLNWGGGGLSHIYFIYGLENLTFGKFQIVNLIIEFFYVKSHSSKIKEISHSAICEIEDSNS